MKQHHRFPLMRGSAKEEYFGLPAVLVPTQNVTQNRRPRAQVGIIFSLIVGTFYNDIIMITTYIQVHAVECCCFFVTVIIPASEPNEHPKKQEEVPERTVYHDNLVNDE